MNLQQTNIKSKVRIMALICCLLSGVSAYGRQESRYFTVQFKDSLAMQQREKILYNNIRFKNIYRQPITLLVTVRTPEGWRSLSDEQTTIIIAPGDKQILPLAITKLNNVTAAWLPVDIHVQVLNTTETEDTHFYIKANAFSRFKIYSKVDNITVFDKDQKLSIALKLTNLGSVTGVYTFAWKCPGLNIDERESFMVPAHGDTEYIYHFKIPATAWSTFKRDLLTVKISDSTGSAFTLIISISKVSDELKMNHSRYTTFPLTLRGGIVNFGNEVRFFGGGDGEITFSNEDKLYFGYTSTEIGRYNQFENNIWHIDYKHKRWGFYAGDVIDQRYFSAYNKGLRINYKWNENGEFNISGSLHQQQFEHSSYYNPYTNDNVTGYVKYGWKKAVILQAASLNFDPTNHLNSYIFWNNIQILKSQNYLLEVSGGIGLDHNTFSPNNNPKELWGSALGYLFTYYKNGWRILSSVDENSNNYPGLKKGYRRRSQNISKQLNEISLGAFYESYFTRSNFFRDTIYYTDVYSTNVTKYGLRTGWGGKGMGVGLTLGILNQEGMSGTLGPSYPFGDFHYSLHKKRLNIEVQSLNGYSNKNGDVYEDLYITQNTISISNRIGGVQGYYVRAPINSSDRKKVTGFSETLGSIVYKNFRIRKHFTGQIQYNISKSLYDKRALSFISGYCNYENEKNGLGVSLSCNIPLQTTAEIIPGLNQRTLTLTASKKFNTPVITRRKYFDLKIVAFYDENSNGIFDNGERLLANVIVDVNGTLFITDNEGSCTYKNVSRGMYTLNLQNAKNPKGLIPSGGYVQKLDVQQNVTHEIAFKKSKLISGGIRLILDSVQHQYISADFLKITAKDTSGKNYLTATDEAGDFYFSLPSGIYSISLNPRAFNDYIKPLVSSYRIDLVNNDEAIVVFEVDQKKRELRMRSFKIN